nr:heme attachment to plastid cytochrome c [Chloromonas rosae]
MYNSRNIQSIIMAFNFISILLSNSVTNFFNFFTPFLGSVVGTAGVENESIIYNNTYPFLLLETNLTQSSALIIESNALRNCSFLCLFLSMIFYWIQTAFSSPPFKVLGVSTSKGLVGAFYGHTIFEKLKQVPNFAGTTLMIISNFLLMFLLIFRWKESGHFPLSNLYESLMFLSWSCTFIHLVLEFKTELIRSDAILLKRCLGSITSPIALFTNAFATFNLPTEMQKASPLVPALQSNWLMMHVTVMIISYSALILGSLLSIAFLILISSFSFSVFDFSFLKQSLQKQVNQASSERSKVPLNPYPSDKPLNLFPFSSEKPSKTASLLVLGTKKQEEPLPSSALVGWDLFLDIDGMVPKQPKSEGASSFKEAPFEQGKENKQQGKGQQEEPFGFRPASLKMRSKKGDARKMLGSVGNQGERTKAKMTLAWNFDNLSYRVLGIGFPFLTIGILSGAVWANEAWGSYWSWDPKETWALLTWLIFAIYLHARITKGWQGKKPAIIASFGFLAIWICFLGVNLIGEGLHSYGWFSNS